jgi:hypothetical protein
LYDVLRVLPRLVARAGEAFSRCMAAQRKGCANGDEAWTRDA